MDRQSRINYLFDRFLRKECSEKELKELMELLQAQDAEDMLAEPMYAVWQQMKDSDIRYPIDGQDIWGQVLSADQQLASIGQIQPHKQTIFTDSPGLLNKNKLTNEPGTIDQSAHRLPARRNKWLVAAAAMIVLIGGIGVYSYFNKPGNDDNATTLASAKQEINRHQEILLPDGSRVILNAASTLDYPGSFNGNTREVYLSGEGFFDIEPDAKRPFLVHTGNITTKVLGTSFNIKAYPSDSDVEVTVATGKVQVLTGDESIGMITANQQLSVSRQGGRFEQKLVQADNITQWKQSGIVFNDLRMREIADSIEIKFNLKIEFADPEMEDCRITASFLSTDSADEMLAVICAVHKASYTSQNNKITIYGKGCK